MKLQFIENLILEFSAKFFYLANVTKTPCENFG